jgi:ribosomal protein L11 methylase PrmA
MGNTKAIGVAYSDPEFESLTVTGAVITSAGIVLAATFAVLGLLPLVPLAQIGFDSFEEMDTGFKAYVPSSAFSQNDLTHALNTFEELFSFSYSSKFIPQTNWNEVWESNFPPVIVSEQVYIYANFHPIHTQYPFHIKMHPKMAFGTGHHETPLQMAEQ